MKNKLKNNKGITLVALVVTIVVLLILAGVSINLVVGQNGIIKKAQNAKKDYEQAKLNEQEDLGEMDSWMNDQLGILEQVDKGVLVEGKNKKYTDTNGNTAVIPVGFKVLTECSDITKGLVIEDEIGNQYVWIPVGSVKKSETETVEIQLGRYTFDTSNGTPTLVQSASEFKDETKVIESYFKELPSDTATAHENTISKDLAGFITSVKTNGGYYIGRYEAGCASTRNSVNDSIEGVKVLEQQGKPVYNYVTQPQASTLCQNLYTTVNSDLMNSYAWDTAIVYIQKMLNINYANQTSKNSSLSPIGTTTDLPCNIYDMASNVYEWTTETLSSGSSPCTVRGGYYSYSDNYTSSRDFDSTTCSGDGIGFRPVLYIK